MQTTIRSDALTKRIADSLNQYAASTFFTEYYFPVLNSSCTREVRMRNAEERLHQRYINCASSNYLNLSIRPEVLEAGSKALEHYGSGANGAPILSGQYEIHEQLEEAIAQFHGAEAALLFPSGYVANLGSIGALCSSNDFVAIDEFGHASIVDGARLSRARLYAFPHNQPGPLRERLTKLDGNALVLVATESVFSMDADLGPLPEFTELRKTFGFCLLLDDAHAVGVLGASGRGGLDHYGSRCSDVDLHVGTLSKTFAGIGGYVAGSRDLIRYLRITARSALFSANIPPAMAACSLAAVRVVEQEGAVLSGRLRRLAGSFRTALANRGIPTLGHLEVPIVPIPISDEEQLIRAARDLRSAGILVNAVRFPAVPRGHSRLRFVLNIGLSEEDLEWIASKVQNACRQTARG